MALFKKKSKEEQTDEQKKVVQEAQLLYKSAYDSKAPYHETWDRCFKAYTGELFKKNLPDYASQEVSNFVFSTIESIKPIMLADNPRFIVMPQKEELLEKANVVQSVMDYEWQRAKMFSHLVRSCTSGLIFGTVPIAMIWDKTAQNGLGDAKPIPISPFNFFVDPMATCIDDAEYCGYATYKHVGEVIKSFPDKAEELRASTAQPSDEYLSYGKTIDTNSSSKYVLYIEMYKRDYSVETEDFEENGVKKQRTGLKYPNGRKITIAGDVLLQDKENEYQDGKFPYVLWKCYDVPGKFWGMGEVEQIISPMQYHANLMNNILDTARLTANSPWILDKNSGIDKNSLTNRHGLVIRKNPGTEVRREQPASLPAYIQNIVEKLEKHMEVIPGVYDVTRGERPSGITAGVAIQALNESAQGRIKLKVQALEQMLSELGGLWLSRIQQFWYTKRQVRTIGTDYTPSYNSIDKDDIDGDFDIVIVAGSTMPVNKTAKLQQLIQMAQTMGEDGLPLVDRKTILENADLANIEQILQRFDQIKIQQQQEAQMQQQQQLEAQQVQAQQSQEQDMAKMQAEQQHEMDSKAVDHQMNMEQMQMQNALQNNTEDVQSKGNSGTDNEEMDALKQIMKYIITLTPEELSKVMEQNPQIAQVVDMLQQMPPEELQQLEKEIQ
jgi:hypothetical protein